jgi:SOS-response transcriptional repressor LexA
MIASYRSIPFVKPAPPQRSKAGHALASRMRDLGLNQSVIAAAMYPKKSQAWVSQSLFDDAESTIIQMVAKNPDNFERLLRVLQWSEADLFKAAGLVPPVVRQEQAVKMNARPFKGGMRLPKFGSVAAGIRAIESQHEPDSYVEYDLSELPTGIQDKERLILLVVNGDSMYVEAGNRPPIPHGSVAMVELWAKPLNGNLAIAWVKHKRYGEFGVVKQYLEATESQPALLRSYRLGGPVFMSNDPELEDIEIVGVVRRFSFDP